MQSGEDLLARTAVEGNILDRVAKIEAELARLKQQDLQAGTLAEMSSDAGDITAGRFICASSDTTEPTDPAFSGSFMSASGESFSGDTYHVGGVNEGALQWGANSTTGQLTAAGGALTIDSKGLQTEGLRYSIQQEATAGSATRYGWLEMTVPDGETTPAWALSFSETLTGLVTNGDIETGDLTGWTDSGSSYSAAAGAAAAGSYGIKCADVESGTQTLTSARFAVVAGSPYRVSVKTNEHAYTSTSTTINASADSFMDNSLPTNNFGDGSIAYVGESNLDARVWRSLIKFDVSVIEQYASVTTASFSLFLTGDYSSNARTMRAYRLLRNWTENGVTWNKFDGTTDWGTAGAGNTSTDREAADCGSASFSATEALATWKSVTLTASKITEWIDGTISNYGVLLQMDTESNDGYALRTRKSGSAPYLSLSYTLPSAYSIRIDYYDADTAGTLKGSTTICSQSNKAGWISRTVGSIAPTGATHAEVVISATRGKGFYVDDIVVAAGSKLYFDDSGLNLEASRFYHKTNGQTNRFISAAAQLPDPPAIVAGSPTTGGAVTVGTHSYKITYYDSYGETTPSAKSNVVTVANTTNDRVPLTIPLGPAGTVGRRIYRTVAGDTGDWKLLVEIPDNTTTTYNDDIADAALGAAAPTTNTTAGRPVFPRNTIIQAEEFYGVPDFTFTNSQVLGYYKQNNSAADGDTYHAWFYADAGADYEVGIFYVKANNAGKMNMFIDGAAIDGGTAFDMYAASTTYNQTKYYTSLTIGQAGMHRITIKANGKNGSSSSYRMPFTMIEIKRASV